MQYQQTYLMLLPKVDTMLFFWTMFLTKCKYGNCTHRHEPGCAVRDAVEKHLISESRYASYLNMLEDKEEGKYRAAF